MKIFRFLVIILLIPAGAAWPQSSYSQKPSAAPANKMPYANMPEQAVPFRKYRKPYYEWYVEKNTLQYNGAARNLPDGDLAKLHSVNIGFLGPLGKNNPLSPYGIAMLRGARMAVDQANARGGYRGKPFALKVHDDLPLWGASAMEIVKMRYQDHDWAMLGSVDGASTHIALRATLKLELPIVNTATNDPTETETRVPWLIRTFPDDRQQGYALADYIFNQLKLKNVGVMRSTSRYGRLGDEIFIRVARRMGRQPVVEMKFSPETKDFSVQLHTLKRLAIDGLVIWGNARQAGVVLKQMRALGMKQPVFGSSRIAYPEVIKIAGPAAEGLVTVCPMDPERQDPQWLAFRAAFLERFKVPPDAYAAYAYDGMSILIAAIRKAGLNRGRIMDALREHSMKAYHGVSGTAFFDYTLNNIAPVSFGKVVNGRFVYWRERRTDHPRIPVASLR